MWIHILIACYIAYSTSEYRGVFNRLLHGFYQQALGLGQLHYIREPIRPYTHELSCCRVHIKIAHMVYIYEDKDSIYSTYILY